MSGIEELTPAEQRAYELIVSEGGLLQSELWKALDATSRTGSRLAMSLQTKGLIERTETTNNGRRTYRLTPARDEGSPNEDSSTDPEEVATEDESQKDLDPREKRALSLVRDRGGIYQSEFWKELDVSSRTGSRLATSLQERGLIRREPTTYNGQRTYRLLPAKKDLDFSLLMAGNEISPLVGTDEGVDPIDSSALTQWMLELAADHQ